MVLMTFLLEMVTDCV